MQRIIASEIQRMFFSTKFTSNIKTGPKIYYDFYIKFLEVLLYIYIYYLNYFEIL
jgi:hypothetical protein